MTQLGWKSNAQTSGPLILEQEVKLRRALERTGQTQRDLGLRSKGDQMLLGDE